MKFMMDRFNELYKACIVLLCCIIIAFSTGCKDKGRYFSPDRGFSIVLPKNWETREKYMGTALMGLSPTESPTDLFRENINIIVEDIKNGISLEEYTHINIQNMKSMLDSIKVNEEKNTGFNRNPARRVDYSYILGIMKMRSVAYFIISGNRAYIITCTALEKSYPRYSDSFSAAVRSFKTY